MKRGHHDKFNPSSLGHAELCSSMGGRPKRIGAAAKAQKLKGPAKKLAPQGVPAKFNDLSHLSARVAKRAIVRRFVPFRSLVASLTLTQPWYDFLMRVSRRRPLGAKPLLHRLPFFEVLLFFGLALVACASDEATLHQAARDDSDIGNQRNRLSSKLRSPTAVFVCLYAAFIFA